MITKAIKYGGMGVAGGVAKIPNIVWILGFASIGGYFLYQKIKSYFDKKANLNNIASANDRTEFAGVSVNVKELARSAHSAIWGGWFENEETFVKAVLQCPKEYITQLGTEYAKVDNKGHNMYQDALKFLRESQYNQIRHLFL